MDTILTASTDVSNELKYIKERIARQDAVLEKVSDLLTETVRIQEKQIASDEKMTDIRKDHEKLELQVAINHDKLSKAVGIWVGVTISASVVIAAFTIAIPLIRSSS
jgi:uncharacterized coiled-coil protein SlyX